MGITIGQRLGAYEITALLGKGGMGEVYRARDTKLKRDVAIKSLPEEFSRDADRVRRFQREAEVLASLNHPNIAAIYDLHHVNDSRYLVLELVEGETLADRVKRGALPVEEALEIAKNICEALEAAHERGIVHRDLKPANVKLTPDGKVKVLDFGLAKAMQTPLEDSTVSNSPTILNGTIGGMILGTAAYMSPEQAKGRATDPRSDIFSVGCIVYEMLAGRQAFHGDDVSDVLASVLKSEPDFSLIPRDLNPRIYELLRRCFEKNPKRRWQAAGDLRVELEIITAAPRGGATLTSPIAQPGWRRAIPVAVASVLIGVAGFAGWSLKPSPPPLVARFQLVLPQDQAFSGAAMQLVAISPDGTRVVYAANNQFFLRQMAEMEARPVPGLTAAFNPFFSPDGQWIGFFSDREQALKKIAVTGGAAITICKTSRLSGVRWDGNRIVFGDLSKGIMQVFADGGEPEVLVSIKPEEGTAFSPQILDSGKAVLFTMVPPGSTLEQAQIVVQSLVSGERKVVLRSGSDARYVPSGHLLYAVGGNILAVPFDLKAMEVKGTSVPIIEGVMRSLPGGTGATHFSISDNGSLVYIPRGTASGRSQTVIAFTDRSGKSQTLPLPPASYEDPRISPDGKQLAVVTDNGNEEIVWIYQLSSGSTPRRLTFGGNNRMPVWSPDGRYVFFRSDRDGSVGIFRQPADGTGTAERLTKAERADERHVPSLVHPSGKILAFEVRYRAGGNSDIWLLPLDGDRTPRPFLEQPLFQAHAVFSPDGRWLAYMSNELENGISQIFVQPYPSTGAKYQITTDGGGEPLWSPDGKQLFYYGGNARLMSVQIQTEPKFSFGKPSPLAMTGVLQEIANPRNYDITPDGKQFVVVLAASPNENNQPSTRLINVVLNWVEELKQRVPVR